MPTRPPQGSTNRWKCTTTATATSSATRGRTPRSSAGDSATSSRCRESAATHFAPTFASRRRRRRCRTHCWLPSSRRWTRLPSRRNCDAPWWSRTRRAPAPSNGESSPVPTSSSEKIPRVRSAFLAKSSKDSLQPFDYVMLARKLQKKRRKFQK